MSDESKTLTPRERVFIAEYMRNGMRIGKAFKVSEGRPEMDSHRAVESGSRMLAKIKKKTADWQRILELTGLDDFTLATEVRKKLRARKSEFYQGAAVATVADNGTQMRAVELLADLLGRRKSTVDVKLEETPKIIITGPEDGE